MKKFTFLLLALVACAFVMSADELGMEPNRSAIYEDVPSGFERVGNTSIFYDIAYRSAAGPGSQYGISILGEIEEEDGTLRYYSSTYQSGGPGAGFIAAFKVDNYNGRSYSAKYLNALDGSTIYDNGNNAIVMMTARVEAQGTVAARIVYTLKNLGAYPATVSAGVWGDIMIGSNDNAPLSRLLNDEGEAYGIRMKYRDTENSPMLCALFGEGITGVTPHDDYWFGRYSTNYYASEIVGDYTHGSNWMQENGSYDSGLGFCWKNRTIEPGESIDLSYLISVGEVDFDPVTPPAGQDIFTANVAAINFDGWNELNLPHPAHVWGHYEHPYGQEGYIEYSVDGGEWIRIETPLTSGEDYDLPFNMMFDENERELHTLELRFTLGMGNYTEIPGLEWEDVRSFELTVDDAERVYNGEPQTFTITVGGLIDYEVQYTDAGEYTFGIYGDYYMETIGKNEVTLTIDKAQSAVNVVLPEDAEYDELPHAATVTVTAGDGALTVTYIKVGATAGSEQAPTEVGVYYVIVEVAETQNYEGFEGTYGPFEIYDTETAVNELSIVTEDNAAWYTVDGRRVAAPTAPGLYIHNGKKYIVK